MNRRVALAALVSLPVVTHLSAQTDDTQRILDAAASGQPLPPGEFYFTPPLRFIDSPGLRGTPGRTILRPLSVSTANQILLDVKTTQPGDISGLPRRSVFEDFRIIGPANEFGYGIMADGAMLRFKRVDVINCYHGVTIGWAVDVDFEDCILRRNAANVYVAGRQGAEATTTIRFRGCQIREARYAGAILNTGVGLTFDNTIVESNDSYGLYVTSGVTSVNCHNVWFENNPTHVYDPYSRVSFTNVPRL